MTNQKQKYQEKLEQRSSKIRTCEIFKKGIQELVEHGSIRKAFDEAESLSFIARTAIKSRIGGVNNFNGFVKYAQEIIRTYNPIIGRYNLT